MRKMRAFKGNETATHFSTMLRVQKHNAYVNLHMFSMLGNRDAGRNTNKITGKRCIFGENVKKEKNDLALLGKKNSLPA